MPAKLVCESNSKSFLFFSYRVNRCKHRLLQNVCDPLRSKLWIRKIFIFQCNFFKNALDNLQKHLMVFKGILPIKINFIKFVFIGRYFVQYLLLHSNLLFQIYFYIFYIIKKITNNIPFNTEIIRPEIFTKINQSLKSWINVREKKFLLKIFLVFLSTNFFKIRWSKAFIIASKICYYYSMH